MTKATKELTPSLDDRLTEKPIPHAYALIPDPDKPGFYYAVHLTGVHATEIEHLEPSQRPSYREFGLSRIRRHMQLLHRDGKGWDE